MQLFICFAIFSLFGCVEKKKERDGIYQQTTATHSEHADVTKQQNPFHGGIVASVITFGVATVYVISDWINVSIFKKPSWTGRIYGSIQHHFHPTSKPTSSSGTQAVKQDPSHLSFDYLLYTYPTKGTGDLLLAIKTVEELKKAFVSSSFALFVDPKGQYSKGFSIAKHIPPGITLLTQEQLQQSRATCLVFVPTTAGLDFDLDKAAKHLAYQHLIELTEYAFERPDASRPLHFATGLGLDFDQQPWAGIFWLSDTYIRGIRSFPIDFAKLEEQDLQTLRTGNYIFTYFATYFWSRAPWVTAMGRILKNKQINFVFPGSKDTIDRMVGLFQKIKSKSKKKNALNIGHIRLVDMISGQEDNLSLGEGQRHVTIYYGTLEHPMLLKLMDNTQYPFVAVTGDQSFAEALSLGKWPIYETLSHKKHVLPSLIKVSDEKGYTDLSKLFLLGKLNAVTAGHYEWNFIDGVTKRKELSTLLGHLQNGTILQRYKALLESLKKEYDLAVNLKNRLQNLPCSKI